MIWPAIPAVLSAGYFGFAAWAGWRKHREPKRRPQFTPPVSILKPVRGTDPRFYDAIASHARLDYPEFEILFGVSEPDDPAGADIERLRREFPHVAIRVLNVETDAANRKVGVLEQLAAAARHSYLVVNDGDIQVEQDYLRRVLDPLRDDATGVVTCLYRATGASAATRMEALGIATEFAPSVLVARAVGVNEFAMGSTLAFRARDLERAGGLAGIRDYLADDYHLGRRITALGLNVVLAQPVVETYLGSGGWSGVWKHQLRWSRTIRISRPGGYLGYVITQTAWWCLVCALAGLWETALLCYAVRVLSGAYIARVVMGDRTSNLWWMPVRDFFGFAVWLAGSSGKYVEWGGAKLMVYASGRIRR